jgi:hypothetical protein
MRVKMYLFLRRPLLSPSPFLSTSHPQRSPSKSHVPLPRSLALSPTPIFQAVPTRPSSLSPAALPVSQKTLQAIHFPPALPPLPRVLRPSCSLRAAHCRDPAPSEEASDDRRWEEEPGDVSVRQAGNPYCGEGELKEHRAWKRRRRLIYRGKVRPRRLGKREEIDHVGSRRSQWTGEEGEGKELLAVRAMSGKVVRVEKVEIGIGID